MNRTIQYTITEKDSGLRIEQFLRRRGYSGQNLAEIKRMPKSILVNGVHYYMRQILTAGDILQVIICETKNSEKIPPVEIPLDIIYEDEDIIVINKPAGMPIHPSMNNYYNSLANALAWYYQEQGKPFIFRCCNRLDRDTSGLTVVSDQRKYSFYYDQEPRSAPGISCHSKGQCHTCGRNHLCSACQKRRHHHRAHG